MKLLCYADVHIENYTTYTTYDSGISRRLLNINNLAKDIVKIAEEYHVDYILDGGDLINSVVNKPRVLNLSNEFLKILCSYCKVLKIHGQHELDEKEDNDIRHNSLISLFENIPNLIYGHELVLDLGEDINIYMRGWSKNKIVDYKEADIFLAHDLVSRAKNCDGYIFKTGYDPDILSKNYRVSVIGDIHNSQLINNNVLIPGVPIQNRFDDPVNTGVWIITLEKDSQPLFKYVPIDSHIYPKFMVFNEGEVIPQRDNLFVRINKKKKEKSDIKESREISVNKNTIQDIIDTLFGKYKNDLTDEEYNRAYSYMKILLEESTSPKDIYSSNDVSISKLVIQNFFSIKDLVLEFNDYDKDVLFIGKNGSGKTNILEFICWILFDSLSKASKIGAKSISKDDIKNDNTKEGIYGELHLKFNNQLFKIIKSRDHSIYGTSWYIEDHVSNSAKQSETQQFINNLLDIKLDEYLDLIYFSQSRFDFFNDLSPSRQFYILKRLTKNVDLVVDMQNRISSNLVEIDNTLKNLESKISIIENVQKIINNSDSLKLLESQILNICPGVNFDDKVDLQCIKYMNDKYKLKLPTLSFKDYFNHIVFMKSKLSSSSNQYEDIKFKVMNVSTNCYACGQLLPTDKIETMKTELINKAMSLSEFINDLDNELKSCIDVESIMIKLNSYISEYTTLNKQKLYKSDEDLESIKSEYNHTKMMKKILDFLNNKIVSDKGLYQYLLNSTGKSIESNMNNYMKDTSYSVKIDTINQSGSSNLGLRMSVSRDNNKSRDYMMRSGAEKRFVGLALMITINNMFIEKRGDMLGLIILDEIFQNFDDEHTFYAKDVLDMSIAKRKFIITHDDKLKSYYDNTIRFYKDSDEEGTKYERLC